MEDTVEVTEVTATVTAMVMVTMAMERGRPMLSLPLLPSLAMDMVMDTDMAPVLTGTDTPPTATDTDTAMARGLLMPSPDMATTAVGTEDTVVDTTDTAMVTVMATTDEVAASRSSC